MDDVSNKKVVAHIKCPYNLDVKEIFLFEDDVAFGIFFDPHTESEYCMWWDSKTGKSVMPNIKTDKTG